MLVVRRRSFSRVLAGPMNALRGLPDRRRYRLRFLTMIVAELRTLTIASYKSAGQAWFRAESPSV
jgi:hypothetical protein